MDPKPYRAEYVKVDGCKSFDLQKTQENTPQATKYKQTMIRVEYGTLSGMEG